MPKSPSPDRLSRHAAEAKNLGLSYGDYIAQYHPTFPPPEPPAAQAKTCPVCGRVFQTSRSRKIYCDTLCKERARDRREYRKKTAKEEKTC